MSNWLAENPELLQAALELVETWDVGYLPSREPVEPGLVSTSSDSGADDDASRTSRRHTLSPLSPGANSKTPQPQRTDADDRHQLLPSTLASTHHRRREEVSSLRRQVAELDRQLESLERNAGLRKRLDPHTARASMWRDIAVRQQQMRNASELEQTKLRERVDEQVSIARAMIQLLHKARQREDAEITRPIKPQRTMSTLAFHDQIMCVGEMYDTMDRIHSHPKFHDGTSKFLDVARHEDRPQQFVVEVWEAWTIPFDEDSVVDALWQFSFKRENDGMCAPEFVLDSEVQAGQDKLVSQFSTLARIGSAQGVFDGQALVKRFPATEASPSAIISSVCCMPSRSSAGDFKGVTSRDLTCIRVLPATPGDRDQSVTRVTFREQFTVGFGNDSKSRCHAEIITTMTLEKVRHSLDVMHKTVETLLLAPRLKSCS